jgi:hypothetical protein
MREGGVAGERETEEMLLVGGKWCGLFGDCRNKGLVVSEEGERTTFEEESEMFGCEESS